MRIIWNGHSCFTLEAAGGTVVVDPYLDGSVPGLEPLRLKADAVYCSHGHRDHGARRWWPSPAGGRRSTWRR